MDGKKDGKKSNPGDFSTDKWSTMTKDERLSLLQSLENTIAELEKRQARTVVAEDMSNRQKPGSTLVPVGYYSPGTPGVLHLNERLLGDKEKFGNYIAAKNVLHEGRHAYQDDVVRGRLPNHKESNETVELWKMNHAATGGIYYNGRDDWTLYRFQPVEDDANIFASESMKHIGNKVSRDDSYKEFSKKYANKDAASEKTAIMLYGKNYREEICNKLKQDYQNKQGASKINSQPQNGGKTYENIDASDNEGMGM